MFLAILMVEFGSMAMLSIESWAPGANIVTASDALWYLVVTKNTVGYGDLFTTTDLGRVLGSVLLVLGLSLFGTFTAFLADLFFRSGEGRPGVGRSDAAAPPESDEG
jgi:voltage-gated potassium channel